MKSDKVARKPVIFQVLRVFQANKHIRISHQTSHDVDGNVCQRAMARVFKVENIFELVIDGFNDTAFSQNQLIESG